MQNTSAVFDTPDNQPPLSKAAARALRRAEKAKKAHGGTGSPLIARTDRQREYLNALWTGESAFAVGGAGVGKTYLAARVAARKLSQKQIDKIIVARVTVSNTKNALGFLPGKLEQKLAPWLIPVFDGLKAEVGTHQVEQWQKEGRLEIASFEHMRGRTFANAFVLLDEAQNATVSDLKLFLTRIGEESQVVITGDLDQIDIQDSGLLKVIRLAKAYGAPMRIIEFSDQDVVRSQFTKEWVRIFSQSAEDGNNPSGNLDVLPPFIHNTRKS